MFINDLKQRVSSSETFVLLSADDTKAYSVVNTTQDAVRFHTVVRAVNILMSIFSSTRFFAEKLII